MHRRTVFDPRTKRWEASVYMLGSRPSDGKMVPILTPIKSVGTAVLTERQVSYLPRVDIGDVGSCSSLLKSR